MAQCWTSSSNFLSFLKKGAANDIPTSRHGRTSTLYNFIRTLGCRLEMVLFMIPRVLFAEDETDLAWMLNFNWWSTITPRFLSSETAERKLSWRKYLWCLLFLPRWITWRLSTLKVRSHTESQQFCIETLRIGLKDQEIQQWGNGTSPLTSLFF